MTIYNGIEFERYATGRRQVLPGAHEGDVVLLCVTTLNNGNKSKGIELVIDAFDEIHTQRKDVKLVVAAKASHPPETVTLRLPSNLPSHRSEMSASSHSIRATPQAQLARTQNSIRAPAAQRTSARIWGTSR